MIWQILLTGFAGILIIACVIAFVLVGFEVIKELMER